MTADPRERVASPMEAGKIGLRFGATCDPISLQLGEQGFALSEKNARQCQADADSITRLHIRMVLTEAEVRKARQRLLRRVAALAALAPRTQETNDG